MGSSDRGEFLPPTEDHRAGDAGLRSYYGGNERSQAMSQYETSREPTISGWVVGGITFAGTMLILIGMFQAIDGLVAIFNDDFYLRTENYTFNLDVSAWGWIHLLLGILLVATAWGLYTGSTWAGVTAIVVASLSAIANFMFIPYYPFWSILVIALNIWVIWALTRPGALRHA
jgi:hypothetical protein